MAIRATNRWAICRRPHFGCDLPGDEFTQAPSNLPFALVEDEDGTEKVVQYDLPWAAAADRIVRGSN
jgi:hypothetical protein